MARKVELSDLPLVDNYPELAQWLRRHECVCLERTVTVNGRIALETWRTRAGAVFVLQVHAKRHGWDVFTASDTLDIQETLRDAERRLKL